MSERTYKIFIYCSEFLKNLAVAILGVGVLQYDFKGCMIGLLALLAGLGLLYITEGLKKCH